jgi:cell division cycle 14
LVNYPSKKVADPSAPTSGLIEVLEGRIYYAAIPQSGGSIGGGGAGFARSGLISHQRGGGGYSATVRGALFPRDDSTEHWFTLDDQLLYHPFFLDFGPLSLGCLYRFCQAMENKLAKVANSDRRIVYYSSSQMNKRANAIYLLAAHSVLYLGKTPEQAMRPFAQIVPPVAPWHDASPSLDTFHLSTLDVLRGILKARACGFFSFESGAFDCDEYETYEKVENGDMNWIVNGRFLAFAGPEDSRAACAALGYHSTAVEDLIPYFQMRRISTVIRLNKRYYNEQRFDRAGIAHHDMYYLDGSNPPEHILQRFLHVCESTRGAIAVHCKAGLGRTGTCIGAYIMKHYRFTAREVIGWMRVCRPGSVIGPQQQFLEEIQQRMWDNGEAFRRSNELPAPAEGSYFATFVEQARKAATVLPSGSPPNVSTSSISSFGGNTSYIPLSIKTQNSTIDKFQHQQHQHLSNARSDLSLKNVSIPHQRIPSSSPIALQGSSSSPSSNSYYSSSSVEGGGGHGSGLESKFAAASSSSSTSYISGMRDALDYETMRSGASAIPFSRSLSTGATNGGGGNNNVGGGGGGRSSGVSADSSAFSTPYLSGLKGGVASGNGFHRLGGGGGGVMVTSSSSLSSSTLVNSQGDLLRTAKNNVRTSPLSLSLKSPSMGLSRR